MSESQLLAEFEAFLEDPLLRSWIQAYIEGDVEASDLVQAALETLEREDEAEEC